MDFPGYSHDTMADYVILKYYQIKVPQDGLLGRIVDFVFDFAGLTA
jgi:hypothetical protein